jgi:sugar phosphate isomerase/epimerase
MEEEFVERWGKILDKFAEYGVKFAHEPHPMNWFITSKQPSAQWN